MNYRIILSIGTMALAAIAPQVALAESGPILEVGYAEAFDISGGELGAGWRYSARNFHLTPAAGVFYYKGDNDRYYVDHMKGGTSQCRDRTNGRFAKSELCNDGEIEAYGRIEATVNHRKLEGGIGYRVSGLGESTYGTLSLKVAPEVAIKANGGQDYYSLSLVMRRYP